MLQNDERMKRAVEVENKRREEEEERRRQQREADEAEARRRKKEAEEAEARERQKSHNQMCYVIAFVFVIGWFLFMIGLLSS